MGTPQPYKIADRTGKNRYGIVVDSLAALMNKAREKLRIESEIKIVIEQDGTEVDEEEYFSALEPHTSFIALKPNEEWIPPSQYNYVNLALGKDERDSIDGNDDDTLINILNRIRSDAGQISLLSCRELEMLSDMDPDSLSNIIPNKRFLKEVKEASCRYLNDKRDTQEALRLLKLYHAATSNMLSRSNYARAVSTATSTSDCE